MRTGVGSAEAVKSRLDVVLICDGVWRSAFPVGPTGVSQDTRKEWAD